MTSDIYRDSIFWVEIERVKPNPFQPRREFDQAKLKELGESIRMYGLLQPLTVTRNELPREDGGLTVEYELIAGERRLRASKLVGLTQIPVIIRTGEETDQMKLELAIIENLQREDLNPIDRAKAFMRLHKDFNFTHVEIGRKVGRSREYVSNTLRLLALPDVLQGYLSEGRISEGHTRPLLMLNDKPEEQTVLAKEILLKKLTVRESEALARRSAQEKVSARHKIDPEILALERSLTEKLGTRVQIEPREVGGRVVISFFSADDLQTLLDSMRVEEEAAAAGKEVFNGTNNMAERVDVTALDAMKEQATKTTVEQVNAEPQSISASEEETVSDASVLADTDRPQPEPATDEQTKQSMQTEEAFTSPTPPQLAPAPVAARQPAEEEENDIYSIRNFSV